MFDCEVCFSDAPEISLITPSMVQIPLSGNLTIECEVDSNPFPDVKLQKTFIDNSWITLQEVPISVSKRSSISTWRFQFTNIDEKISGSYRCSAVNDVGSMAFTKIVNVSVINTGNMALE